ncbi:hypothetical protein MXD63_39220, partial [Frankia sp. Cpl3]|nr:hypothetical protein [Frankia sp. Cpl3]
NILAGFRTPDDAGAAAEALRQAGFQTIQVDMVSKYPGDGVEKRMNPITGAIPSLGTITLGANFPSARDASVLAAADPAASGMSDGGQDTSGATVLLTAVVPEERGDEATEILRSFGAEI